MKKHNWQFPVREFNPLRAGTANLIVRPDDRTHSLVEVGDLICTRGYEFRVVEIRAYPSFDDALFAENYEKVQPGKQRKTIVKDLSERFKIHASDEPGALVFEINLHTKNKYIPKVFSFRKTIEMSEKPEIIEPFIHKVFKLVNNNDSEFFTDYYTKYIPSLFHKRIRSTSISTAEIKIALANTTKQKKKIVAAAVLIKKEFHPEMKLFLDFKCKYPDELFRFMDSCFDWLECCDPTVILDKQEAKKYAKIIKKYDWVESSDWQNEGEIAFNVY